MNFHGFYFITDSKPTKNGVVRDVEEAIRGGASIIQYREKEKDTGPMVEEAKKLKQVCQGKSTFLINGKTKDPGGINFAAPGDTITFFNPGGGGYGDPLERDPEIVRSDVVNGYVSFEMAREAYGVVIEPETGEVDCQATEKVRLQKHQESEG